MFASAFVDFAFGQLELTASDLGLRSIMFSSERLEDHIDRALHPVLRLAERELQAYFNGSLTAFSVPLDLTGHSEFNLKVWQKVRNIPYGETRSYSDIAVSIGNHDAVRAVGLANGRNPIPIIVPCHRVIGNNGSLTGYAYGLEMKQWLLELEWLRRKTPSGMLF